MKQHILWFLEHPEAIMAVVILLRVLYAMVSRLVRPYPRLRAAVESVSALGPDVLRAVQQGAIAATGRPVPGLEVRAPEEDRAALLARAVAAENALKELQQKPPNEQESL